MRTRDVLIVGVALLCCVVVWSQQGAVNLQPSFKIPVGDDEMRVYVMPKPAVVDPRGDGKPVLVASPSVGSFRVYNTHFTNRNMEGVFVPLAPASEYTTYGRVLGFGVGSVVANSSLTVLAVLADDYRLRVFDAKSEYQALLWESEVAPPNSWGSVLHASVSVVPERVYDGDSGMVVVAVKAIDPWNVPLTLFAAFDGHSGELRWRYLSDAANDLDDVVREAADTSPLRMNGVEDLLNVPHGVRIMGKKETGARAGAAKGAAAAGREEVAAAVLRTYEKPWTTFREAVIAALPHHYNHPWDAQLRPHALYPQKAKNKQRSKAGTKMTFLLDNRLVRMDAEDYGLLGERLNLWNEENAAAPPPALNTHNNPENTKLRRRRKVANAFVFHSKAGIEMLHMYTGSVITQVVPLKANADTYYHDINDDFHIEAITTQIGPRMAMEGDNKVDLIDDCLGMIYTGSPVAEDEVFNATICDTQGFFGNLDLIHHFVDGDVRGEGTPHSLNMLELLGSRNIVSKTTRSVPPLVVQVHTPQGHGVNRMERYAVFMIDTGLVTCLDPSRRRVLWRAQTDVAFADYGDLRNTEPSVTGLTEEEKDSLVRPYPHLATYSFYQRSHEDFTGSVGGGKSRYRRTDPYVLAVGERGMAVINSKNGKVVRRVPLPEPPVAPVIVSDFNGDGVNDVIVVTERHIYGFIGSPQASTGTVTSLMVLMIALLVLLFVARELTITGANSDEYSLPATQQDEVVHLTRGHKRATD